MWTHKQIPSERNESLDLFVLEPMDVSSGSSCNWICLFEDNGSIY